MKPIIHKLIPFLLFPVLVYVMSCSVDPLSTDALRGTWGMLSFTDKEKNITFVPGIPKDTGNGVTQSISGVLLVSDYSVALQDSEINIIITTRTTVPGEEPQDERERFFGRYVIDDSILTIALFARGQATGETKTFKISRNDLRLTLEDNASLIEWGKLD